MVAVQRLDGPVRRVLDRLRSLISERGSGCGVGQGLQWPGMTEVTRILDQIQQGDPQAAEQLLPLVYDELRKLAARRLAQEKPGQTLQATALVHEAYLRLVDVETVQHWDSRRHFFAAAAEAMRRILVESARRKSSRKRGGGRARADFEHEQIAAPEIQEDVVALDQALMKLAGADKMAADLEQTLVNVREFAAQLERTSKDPRIAQILQKTDAVLTSLQATTRKDRKSGV